MSPIGRPCAVCSKGSATREAVDRAIVEGRSFRDISQQFEAEGISYHSIWRHAQVHLSQDLRDAVTDAQSMKVGQFAVRLQEIADRAREASDTALTNGNPRDVARAVDSEIRALMVLMQRMGINDRDTVESLREGHALVTAMIRITRAHPEIGLAPLLMKELRELNEHPMADAIERSTTKEIEK